MRKTTKRPCLYNPVDCYRYMNHAEQILTTDGYLLLGPARTKLYPSCLIDVLKLFIYFLMFSERTLTKLVQDKEILFFFGNYVNKQKNPRAIINGFLEIVSDVILCPTKPSVDIKSIFLVPFLSLRYFKMCTGVPLAFRLLYALASARSDCDLRYYLKINFVKKQTLITFCDAIGIENLIVQIAKRRGLRTVTLQHGQYRRLPDHLFSQDIEALKNFQSDYMLSWGEATKIEFSKYGIDENRLVSVGHLAKSSDPEPSACGSEIKDLVISECKTFGLILNGKNTNASNDNLLMVAREISEKYKLNYYVQPHPLDITRSYCKLTGSLGKIKMIENSDVDFLIMGMTGYFINCIRNHKPFLFYDNRNLPEVFKHAGLHFSNIAELNHKWRYDFSSLKRLYDDDVGQKQKIKALFND